MSPIYYTRIMPCQLSFQLLASLSDVSTTVHAGVPLSPPLLQPIMAAIEHKYTMYLPTCYYLSCLPPYLQHIHSSVQPSQSFPAFYSIYTNPCRPRRPTLLCVADTLLPTLLISYLQHIHSCMQPFKLYRLVSCLQHVHSSVQHLFCYPHIFTINSAMYPLPSYPPYTLLYVAFTLLPLPSYRPMYRIQTLPVALTALQCAYSIMYSHLLLAILYKSNLPTFVMPISTHKVIGYCYVKTYILCL